MTYKPKNYDHLLGTKGFSEKLLKNHFNLYQGYVKNTNTLDDKMENLVKAGQAASPEFSELKRRFGWEFNGMRLHELYFGNMIKEKTELSKDFELTKKIVDQFGSLQTWEKDFKATGAMRGIGWTMLCSDPEPGRLFNIWIDEHDVGLLAESVPLLVMDVFEHAFVLDYGMNRGEYIGAFFNAISWNEVARRFEVAMLNNQVSVSL